MRRTLKLSAVVLLASAAAIGCGHGEQTTIRRETVTSVPPPSVVERQTTVETAPAPPVIEQRSTTVRSGSVERTYDEN